MKACADCGEKFSGPPEIELCAECADEHEQQDASLLKKLETLTVVLENVRELASKAEKSDRPDVWIQTLGFIVNVINETKQEGM